MINAYAKAYTEVLEILKYIPVTEYLKIPQEKILEFEKNKDKDYKFVYDKNLGLDEQNILKETKLIIVTLFRDYFSTPVQKAKLEKILIYNENVQQKLNTEKYDYENMFKTQIYSNENDKNENLPVVVKENIFLKTWNKIKSFFIKKN